MITRLYLDGAYRHFNRTFTFDKGLTGVVGPNESGKSLIVEMIRYALFGTKALRSSASKQLHVELDFSVNGENYTVVRKNGKAELVGIASGIKPVNEAIQRILGYDLVVFDVANACNQGQVESLGNMRPAERKAMVDRTVGLDLLDHLIQFCGTEANTLKREAEAMKRGLLEPIEPKKPEKTVSLKHLESTQAWAREQFRLYELFTNAPEKVEFPRTQAEISAEIEERRQIQRLLDQRPPRPIEPKPFVDNEDELVTHEQVRLELMKLKPEPHSAEELDAFEESITRAERWEAKKRLLDQGHICCPNCNHEWPVADLSGYEDVEEAPRPSITRAQIASYRLLIGNRAKLEAAGHLEDRSKELARLRQLKAEHKAYQAALQAWEKFNKDLPALEARLAQLTATVEDLHKAMASDWWKTHGHKESQLVKNFETIESETFNHYQNGVEYERLLRHFKKLKFQYDELCGQVANIERRSEQYFAARERIIELKKALKSYLLPSLNKVASSLLAQMTGGERSSIVVNDEFEISVDGQALETLSGSGKSVANLAVRIALGQILTNRVFSIFMADEVDAAMDEVRAEYTAQALRRLTSMVTQVILVTHKRPETDHIIELRK